MKDDINDGSIVTCPHCGTSERLRKWYTATGRSSIEVTCRECLTPFSIKIQKRTWLNTSAEAVADGH